MAQRPSGYSPEEISVLLDLEVIEAHASGAASLWNQRNQAVWAPHYRVKDLRYLEERLEANLDGLRVAFAQGWTTFEPLMPLDLPGDLFAAGVFALEHQLDDFLEKIIVAACADPQLIRPLISAFGWLPLEQVMQRLVALIQSSIPPRMVLGIGGLAVQRRNPGEHLYTGLMHADPILRARSLKAVGELGVQVFQPQLQQGLSDKDPTCRFYAAWSAARIGDRAPNVLALLQAIAAEESSFSDRAAAMAARCLDRGQAKAWCQELLKKPEQQRIAAIATGALGLPEMIPELLTIMSNEEASRCAGEAFSFITGADLAYLDLDLDQEKSPVDATGNEPDTEEDPPEEDAEKDDSRDTQDPDQGKSNPKDPAAESKQETALAPVREQPQDEETRDDPDADLPWPDPALISHRWHNHKARFKHGTRYLGGKEIQPGNLKETLLEGCQRQRHAAALEQALLDPTAPMFEVRAPIRIQLQRLGK